MVLIIFSIKAPEEDVYIQYRKNTRVYHNNTSCVKLKHPQQLRKISLKEAEDEYGRVACKFCR